MDTFPEYADAAEEPQEAAPRWGTAEWAAMAKEEEEEQEEGNIAAWEAWARDEPQYDVIPVEETDAADGHAADWRGADDTPAPGEGAANGPPADAPAPDGDGGAGPAGDGTGGAEPGGDSAADGGADAGDGTHVGGPAPDNGRFPWRRQPKGRWKGRGKGWKKPGKGKGKQKGKDQKGNHGGGKAKGGKGRGGNGKRMRGRNEKGKGAGRDADGHHGGAASSTLASMSFNEMFYVAKPNHVNSKGWYSSVSLCPLAFHISGSASGPAHAPKPWWAYRGEKRSSKAHPVGPEDQWGGKYVEGGYEIGEQFYPLLGSSYLWMLSPLACNYWSLSAR